MINWALETGQKEKFDQTAKKMPQRALDIAKALKNAFMPITDFSFNYVKALKLLGESYFEIEDFVRAKLALEECKKIALEIQDDLNFDDSIIVKARQILGKCHYELGMNH